MPCEHCGFRGPLEHKGNVISWVEQEDPEGHGPSWEYTVGVYWCRGCREATVHTWGWSPEMSIEAGERVLYPTRRDNSSLPETVGIRLDAAMKVKRIDPGLYAVGIGRMLEAVCKEQGATGKDLFAKLDDLVVQGKMPEPLTAAAHELRKLRNLGAHDEAIEVAADDVTLIEALGEAILEYLYRAPAAVAAVRAGLAQRRA
jgi:Domain of unknown function (DUF4145)